MGCIALTGLSFSLGANFSTGSDDWPALVGVDAVIFMALAYLLDNRPVLIYACVNLFIWFGGQTGYISGWGAYWLGMNYPVRFIVAGMISAGIGIAHARAGQLKRFSHFNRVYLHFGALVVNLALWFFALFGYFEEDILWYENTGERLGFSLLWAAVSGISLYLGLRRDNGILRSYGLVFLIINGYTFYFQFIAANSAEFWFLHALLIGGTLIALGFKFEKMKKFGA